MTRAVVDQAFARRRVWLYALIAILSLLGLADATYLTVGHLTGETVRCTITGGCAEVLGSPYAVVAGVPLAMVGAAAYFSVFSLSTLTAFGYRIAGVLLTPLLVGMFLVSLWLVYLQAFVIRHFCQYCLLSASVTTAMTIVAAILFVNRNR